ncbi:MAG: hypothetical protein SGCHY_004097, partial [Lobulomycetales sp.]
MLGEFFGNERNDAGFDGFSTLLETTLHAGVHVGIGGDMSELRNASNDPLFYLLHSNVDRIWAEFQRSFPDLGQVYSGSNEVNGTVSLDDVMDF